MRKEWEQGKERRYLSWSSKSAPFASDFQAGKFSHTRIDMSMMCMWNFGLNRLGGWRLAAFALGAPACLTGLSTVSGVNPLSGLLSSCWVRTVELWSRLSRDFRPCQFAEISGYKNWYLEMCFTTSNYVRINFVALGFIKHTKSYDLKDERSARLYAQKACAMHKNRARACYIECPW